VQMYFWSRLFVSHGWQVESLTAHRGNRGKTIGDIRFIWLPTPWFVAPAVEMFKILSVVIKRPDVIIVRGATRSLFMLSLFCRLFAVKLVVMFASDSDLYPGQELIARRLDKKLFEWGIRLCRRFICQNSNQCELLKKNYHHRTASVVTIPNIWLDDACGEDGERRNILWVSNFRDLKHPEAFLELAKAFPEEHFMMAGGFTKGECYKRSQRSAGDINNLEFLGPVSFEHSQRLFRSAKLFVCTSDTEGFPNTFLQAFSNGIPVLTTFDPSDIVKAHGLGLVVRPGAQDELNSALNEMLNDPGKYEKYAGNASAYFARRYSAEDAWRRLLEVSDLTC